jgi:hypothetical protein
MIYTCMWAYDCQEDWEIMKKILGIFESAGAELYCVELTAPLDVRLKRNETENRLKNKASKGDIEASNARLIRDTKNHRFVSLDGEIPIRNFMRIDNSNIEPDVVAKMIKGRFDL